MNIQLTKKEHTTNNDIDCRRAARRITTARFFDGVSREIGRVLHSNCCKEFGKSGRVRSGSRVSGTSMKRNVLLVTSNGNDLIGVLEEAARKTGRGLRKANNPSEGNRKE